MLRFYYQEVLLIESEGSFESVESNETNSHEVCQNRNNQGCGAALMDNTITMTTLFITFSTEELTGKQ
jgi:hypothetical protein